ncbi:MAG: flagellar basal body P-ring formation chaperone FlgA [Mariprofundaceae bacterium]|nr:flagellar basal body P-ring formation chaperone FlgA [Mariprofundaceae bacterium]
MRISHAFKMMVISSLFLVLQNTAWASPLNESLQEFFKQGVVYDGAQASLIEVIREPNIQGKVRWILPPLRSHASRLSVIAEQGAGRRAQRWYVPIKVHWWANVVTVRQELPSRSLLQASMLQVERQDVAGHGGSFWTSKQALLGMRLTRPMHAHDVVFSNMVKRPPLLQRGDRVSIVAGNDFFSVRADGVVMRSGGLGDKVLVQNMRSKQRVQAIIVDAHTVKVHI